MLATLLVSGVIVVAPTPGPGVDFTSIADAAQAANDGDIVLVRSGSYFGDVALPAGGGNIAFVADGASPPSTTQGVWGLHALQASQAAVVRGFELNGFFASLPYTTAALQVGAGNVFVEDCVVNGSHSCIRVAASGWLALTRCTALASQAVGPSSTYAVGTALSTFADAGSLATVHDCTLRGGNGMFGFASGFIYGIAAREAVNWKGKLYASHGSLVGGAGAGSNDSWGYCALSSPGAGVVIEGVAHTASPQIASGAHGPLDAACQTPYVPPGIGGGIVFDHPGSAPLLSSSRVTREGQTLSATLAAASGEYAVLLAATSVQRVELDAYVGVLVNPAAGLLPLGLVGAGGSISASAVVQDLGAGVEGAVLFLQGATIDPGTLAVRLSNVSVATLVDAAL